jgi:hypothetical protein
MNQIVRGGDDPTPPEGGTTRMPQTSGLRRVSGAKSLPRPPAESAISKEIRTADTATAHRAVKLQPTEQTKRRNSLYSKTYNRNRGIPRAQPRVGDIPGPGPRVMLYVVKARIRLYTLNSGNVPGAAWGKYGID